MISILDIRLWVLHSTLYDIYFRTWSNSAWMKIFFHFCVKTFCGCLSFRMDFLNFWTKKFMYSSIYESLSSSTLNARFFFFLSPSSFSPSLLVLFHFSVIFQTFNFPNKEVKPKENNSVDSKTAMNLCCYCSLGTCKDFVN